MLHMFRRLSAALLLMVTSGCGTQSVEDERSDWPGAEPLTWGEYVTSERPRRARYEGQRYSRPGLPNMSRWQPSDFLPEAVRNTPQVEACSLEQSERTDFSRAALRFPNDDTLRQMRGWAERGVTRARQLLGSLCWSHYARSKGLDSTELTDWARMAAASGSPAGMSTLASCIEKRRWSRNGDDVPNTPGDPRPWLDHVSDYMDATADEFFVDEVLYWYWRAARSLEPSALTAMARLLSHHNHVGDGYVKWPRGQRDALIQHYHWTQLAEIAWSIHDGRRQDADAHEGALQQFADTYAMAPAEVTQARALSRDWLLHHPEALSGYIAREDLKDCEADVSADGMRFNFQSLNRRLGELNLRYNPDTGQLHERPRTPSADA